MKRDDQAHTYGPKNSNFLNSSQENSAQNSKPEIQEISLSEAIEDFKLMAKVEGQADKTLELYDYVFKRFLGFASEEKPVTEIKAKEIRKYLASLLDDGLKDTSVAIHFRHLRAFFNWLVEEKYLQEAPTNTINEPKTPNKFPRVLDSKQVQKLLQAAKDRHGD
ncbi:MAG: tyrosine-type recombinase/integrase, partial [Candidatus Bipolaricaulota bacterium]